MFKRVVVAVLMVAALAVSAPGSAVVEAQGECGPPYCDWPPPGCEPIVRCAYVPWLGGWFCWLDYPCSA